MLTRIRRLFAAPVFEDEDQTRAAGVINAVLLIFVALAVGMTAWLPVAYGMPLSPDQVFVLLSAATAGIILIGLLLLLRRGHVQLISVVLSSLLWVIPTVYIYAIGGIGDIAIIVYFPVIILAGLLLGGRAVIAFGLLCILSAMGAYYIHTNGIILISRVPTPAVLLALSGILGGVTLLLRFAVRSINEGFDRARRHEQALVEGNRELQASRDALETRSRELERRSVQLRAASEVARDATATRDLDELLSRAVNLIQERFGFYHASVFLVDERGENAVLRAGTGEAGRQLVEQGFRLPVGKVGIIGYVTGSGQSRIALDVDADAVYFKNPLLPETRSEMALPLRAGDRVIGALDVQSREPAAFDEDDAAVLQTMADQLAVAIENIRLLHEMERTVHELEAASGRYTQEAWRAVAGRHDYRYRRLGVEPAAELSPEARQAWSQGRSVAITPPETSGVGPEAVSTLAVPVKLRDQVVGVLDLRFEGAPVSPDTISLVEESASRLALALETARLLEDTQRRAAQERLTGEVTARMRETLDVETVLKTAASEMRQALGLDDLVIRLTSGEGEV
jgi:GAF domain-containing protein